MSARFEVVRTDAGWHSRFVAANGKTVWTTEVYKRRGGALNAVASLVDPFLGHWVEPRWVMEIGDSWNKTRREVLEIRDVDERTEATS